MFKLGLLETYDPENSITFTNDNGEEIQYVMCEEDGNGNCVGAARMHGSMEVGYMILRNTLTLIIQVTVLLLESGFHLRFGMSRMNLIRLIFRFMIE